MSVFTFDTQTPDVYSLTPSTKSNVLERTNPWGRLYSTYIHLEPVDLEKQSFKLGRSEDCDVIITEEKVPIHRVTSISKNHFIITKEDSLVYIIDLSKNGTFLNGKLIGKGNKNILQNDDEIAIGFKGLKVYVFKVLDKDENKYLPLELRKKYQVSRVLGKGACGEVRLIYDKETCLPYAVKKIIKGKDCTSEKHKLNHPDKIQCEIHILKTLNHPGIIELREIVECDGAVFIVLEYMEQGELNHVISLKRLSDKEVKFLFYQILLALQYLHNNDVTHRDLKPENILLKKKNNDTLIKISDFGLSKFLSDENIMITICGTPNYVAPEIINPKITSYTKQVDIWSLGVILYYMLSQEQPFRAKDRGTLELSIMEANYHFNNPVWEHVSPESKDLVKKMLVVNPEKRIKIEEILEHPWISKDILMVRRVDDLLYSEFKTTVQQSDSDSDCSYSSSSKKIKLSESF